MHRLFQFLNLSYDNKKNRYYSFLLKLELLFTLVLLFVFPFGIDFLPYLIWMIGLAWLFKGGYKTIKLTLNDKGNSIILVFILTFYILHLIGFIYTDNIHEGLLDLQVKLSLILFPIFLFRGDNLYHKNFNTLLSAFVAGTIISAVTCYLVALYHTIQIENNSITFNLHPPEEYQLTWFAYKYFSLFHHPSYFATYLILSLSVFIYRIVDKSHSGRQWKYFNIAGIIFISVTLFIISSRTGILTWGIILIYFFVKEISRRKRIIMNWLYLFSLIILTGIILSLTLWEKRFQSIQSELSSRYNPEEGIEIGSAGLRLILWDEALTLIKSNWIFGIGPGDVKDELHKRAIKENFEQVAEKNLNIHNQYLETFLGLGLPGILLLIALFLIPLIYKPGMNHYIFPYFLLIISINFIFESMLDRLGGVAFFSFFYSLFVFTYRNYQK